MIYYIQRLILNDNQWTRPSPGRLGIGEGKYVQEAGFGHEDWNFNYDLAVDGYLHGYVYYYPVKSKVNETFNFAFATYQSRQWYLVGFYRNCRFIPEGAPYVPALLKERAAHLMDLKKAGSLGKIIPDHSQEGILKFLRAELKHLRLKVHVGDAIVMPHPAPIPKNILNVKNYRIPRPTSISENVFNQLMVLGLKEIPTALENYEDSEFPEGREAEITHIRRERSPELIRTVKTQFLKTHGRLYCQVCDFDFKLKYGAIGDGFIEAHHIVPVKDLPPGGKTKISDIALVCSNCHRMLHRSKRWLQISELKALLKEGSTK